MCQYENIFMSWMLWPTTSVAELLSNGKNIKKDADKLHLHVRENFNSNPYTKKPKRRAIISALGCWGKKK